FLRSWPPSPTRRPPHRARTREIAFFLVHRLTPKLSEPIERSLSPWPETDRFWQRNQFQSLPRLPHRYCLPLKRRSNPRQQRDPPSWLLWTIPWLGASPLRLPFHPWFPPRRFCSPSSLPRSCRAGPSPALR